MSTPLSRILELVHAGRPVLVHHEAGADTTTLCDKLEETIDNSVVATASCHHNPLAFDVMWWGASSQSARRWSACKLLIIDDVHLLTVEKFTDLNDSAKAARQSADLFGGVPVVLIADFWQTPPNTQILFEYIRPMFPDIVTLPSRIQDPEMARVLGHVRRGHLDYLPFSPDRIPSKKEVTLLSAVDATAMNDKILNALILGGCTPHAFVTSTLVEGSAVSLRGIEEIDRCIFHDQTILTLCVGCRVMLMVEYLPSRGLVQGIRGTVLAFTHPDGLPLVLFDNGVEIVVEEYSFGMPRYPKLERIRMPLLLAWAVALEWVPAFSLDNAIIPTTRVDAEMMYTALSRCKTLDDAVIMGPRLGQTGRIQALAEMYPLLHSLQ